MSGALLGHVFNRQLAKLIPVYLAETGPGYRRLVDAIDPKLKALALAKVKNAFESGDLFTDEAMKQMERLTIKNMTHESDGDKKPHYSVVGENVSGEEIKGGHVQEDETLQTRAN